MRLTLPVLACFAFAACGSVADVSRTAARCDAAGGSPRCELLRVHARAVQLREDLGEAVNSCRRAGDDVGLACVETLTHRAEQVELVLSDDSRAERDPEVVRLGDQYVGALEQTFHERCLGGRPACADPNRFVARAR